MIKNPAKLGRVYHVIKRVRTSQEVIKLAKSLNEPYVKCKVVMEKAGFRIVKSLNKNK